MIVDVDVYTEGNNLHNACFKQLSIELHEIATIRSGKLVTVSSALLKKNKNEV